MSPLCSDDRSRLLDLARRAIFEAVCRGRLPEVRSTAGALAEPAGAFVSLHRQGQLCGCVGQVRPSGSLAETIVRCAIGAALADPRFPPMRPQELANVEIEISVLSLPEPVQAETIEIGRHGLIVARGEQRGVLLPQVATRYQWTRERFLEETCAKAGLEPDAWKDPATQLSAFTAEVFSDADFSAEPRTQAS